MKRFHFDRGTLRRNAVLILSLLCIALLIHEIFGEHGYLAMRRQKKEADSLEQQIQRLQRENQELEKQVKALKSDPRAIERVAREQMRMARPGELIFTLPENDSKVPPPGDTPKKP